MFWDPCSIISIKQICIDIYYIFNITLYWYDYTNNFFYHTFHSQQYIYYNLTLKIKYIFPKLSLHLRPNLH